MLDSTNRERYEKIKKLDKNQKELYKWFKDVFYQKKCNGNIIDKNVQEQIKKLIFSTNDHAEYSLIRDNKHTISANLPYEEEGEVVNIVFNRLLNTIRNQNIHLENMYFFDEPSIFTVLRNVENISNNLDDVDRDRIFKLLNKSKNDEDYQYTVKVALKFLIHFAAFKDEDIISSSINILIGKNRSKKEVIDSLINVYSSYKVKADIIKIFIDTIYYEDDVKTINNINKIINKIFTYNKEERDYLFENSFLIKNLIQKINYYSNNSNINIIVDLIDNKFIRINKEIQYIIIDKTAEMKFSGEEHIKLYKKIVNNILTDSKNYNVVNYYLNKITEVKSLKSLEMLLDLYPFMSKHTKSSHNYIFNQLSDLDNLENIDYDDKTKRKKLIIPLNID